MMLVKCLWALLNANGDSLMYIVHIAAHLAYVAYKCGKLKVRPFELVGTAIRIICEEDTR